MRAGSYTVGLTLQIEAETGQVAIEVARAAGLSLQSQGVKHCSMDTVALPLFAAEAFTQYVGQTALAADR